MRSDGIVVTNCHVVEGATKITVFTSAEKPEQYDARVIGGDCEHDLAVLKIDGKNLPTVPLGNSADLVLGQSVVAIGYALALEGGPSVTTGIVSSLDRVVQVQDPNCDVCQNQSRTYSNVIQTDAAINHGNSGGPLLNLAGSGRRDQLRGRRTPRRTSGSRSRSIPRRTRSSRRSTTRWPPPATSASHRDRDAAMAYQLGLKVDSGAYVVATIDGRPRRRGGHAVGRRDRARRRHGRCNTADDLGSDPRTASSPVRRCSVTVDRDGQPADGRRDAGRAAPAHRSFPSTGSPPRRGRDAKRRGPCASLCRMSEPMAAGERVVLLDQRGRTYLFMLQRGGDLPHALGHAGARPVDRAPRGHPGRDLGRHGRDGVPPSVRGLRPEDEARRAGDLPEGPRADHDLRGHLPRRAGPRGGHGVGRHDDRAVPRGRRHGPDRVLRAA